MDRIDANNTHTLDPLFHPRAIAIVGVSNSPSNPVRVSYLEALQYCGFKGAIYPVNPNESSVMGMKCYTSLMDIPGPVDLVIVGIAARFSLQLVRECIDKGVKFVSFYTSGFSETGEKDGASLEAEILRIAKAGEVRILGPNCMGMYCPGSGLSFISDFPAQSGNFGFVSQSGGNAVHLVRGGAARNIFFSKLVSYGNASDINESDILEYLTCDPETEIIGGYVEGVKDGKRFKEVLKKAAEVKPVIILKGGTSEAGATTAVSHTSAMAGSNKTWEALFRQANVIQVTSLDELMDVVLLLSTLSPPQGSNMGILGIGGGASVLSADTCVRAGLGVPPLPEEIKQELINIAPVAGNIYTNPIDASQFFTHGKDYARAVKALAAWEKVDVVLLSLEIDMLGYPYDMRLPLIKEVVNTMIDVAGKIAKPVIIVLHTCGSVVSTPLRLELQKRCFEAKIPCFPSVERAANALGKVVQYFETKKYPKPA